MSQDGQLSRLSTAELNAVMEADAAASGGRTLSPKRYEAIAAALRSLTVSESASSRAAADISAERQRQIEKEGWNSTHDQEHEDRELARAALSYLQHYIGRRWVFKDRPDDYRDEKVPDDWPWGEQWWKPKDPRRDLVRAAALIAAQIDRDDAEGM